MPEHHQLLESGQGDGRQTQQEGEARGFFATQIEEHGGGQGRARAGHARNQRPDLGDPHDQCIAQPHLRDVPVVPADPLRQRQQRGHGQAGVADDAEAPQRRVAGVEQGRQQQTGDADGNGRQHDHHRQQEVQAVEVALAHRGQAAAGHATHIAPEIADHRGQRRHLHGGGKGRAGVAPAEQGRYHPHVRRGRNGKQLGDTLHHAEKGDLRVAERGEADVQAGLADVGHERTPG